MKPYLPFLLVLAATVALTTAAIQAHTLYLLPLTSPLGFACGLLAHACWDRLRK